MILYTFDKEKLQHRNVTLKVIGVGVIATLLLTSFILGFVLSRVNDVKYISAETKSIIIKESDRANAFSKQHLKAYILELNIKFPYIVYAQARLESRNFNSDVFKANNNMFGMRIATTRPSTNHGEQLTYALYTSWKESVEDYAMFSAAYLNKIKTEDEYFQYLADNYAQDPTYVARLKAIIKEEGKFLKN